MSANKITVTVSGAQGSGKTTLISLLVEMLENRKRYGRSELRGMRVRLVEQQDGAHGEALFQAEVEL